MIGQLPWIRFVHTYMSIVSAGLQVIASLCLYPCFYPLFDGVAMYAYFFLAFIVIVVDLAFFELTSACCCGKQRTFANCLWHLVYLLAALCLLAGGIVFSPFVGHQQDRELFYIYGESLFILLETIKMGLHLRKQGSINFSRLSSRPEFLTSFFACFSWLTQLIGTIMFSYSIYLQSLVVLGAFFYGMSAVLWAIKVWLSLNDSSQVTSRPCPNSKEPEENELNELPSQSE